MRPYAVNDAGILAPDLIAELYVKRDTMTNHWRLAWIRPNDDSYCYAEGECSAIYYPTRKAAIAGGIRRYGETAKRWNGV